MQVILLQDVKSLGKKGDIVKVSDGYARNYVIPKKLGVEATEKNKNELRLQKAHEDKLAAQKLADAKATAEDLSKRKIVVFPPRRSPRRPKSSTGSTSTRRRSRWLTPSRPSAVSRSPSSSIRR